MLSNEENYFYYCIVNLFLLQVKYKIFLHMLSGKIQFCNQGYIIFGADISVCAHHLAMLHDAKDEG